MLLSDFQPTHYEPNRALEGLRHDQIHWLTHMQNYYNRSLKNEWNSGIPNPYYLPSFSRETEL